MVICRRRHLFVTIDKTRASHHFKPHVPQSLFALPVFFRLDCLLARRSTSQTAKIGAKTFKCRSSHLLRIGIFPTRLIHHTHTTFNLTVIFHCVCCSKSASINLFTKREFAYWARSRFKFIGTNGLHFYVKTWYSSSTSIEYAKFLLLVRWCELLDERLNGEAYFSSFYFYAFHTNCSE